MSLLAASWWIGPSFEAGDWVACPSRLLPPGAAATGYWLPGALGHDLRDVVIAEPEVLADERARDRPRRGLGAQPGLADPQDLRGLSWRMKLSHFPAAYHYALLFFRQGVLSKSE
jgi:hypothetical protein